MKPRDPLDGQWRLPLDTPRTHTLEVAYTRCASPRCKVCRNGKGHGPYLFAVWRERRTLKRLNLGNA